MSAMKLSIDVWAPYTTLNYDVLFFVFVLFCFVLFALLHSISLYSHSNIENKINLINDELNEMSNWFKPNKLLVNTSKTNYMILGTPYIVSKLDELDTNVILNNTNLESVNISRYANWRLSFMEKSYWLCFKNNFSKYWCHA